MGHPVPTLSGWIFDLAGRADLLMANYFASDYSQSNLYRGEVVALAAHVQRHGGNADELRIAMSEALTRYFARYFDASEVVVRTSRKDDDPKRIDVRLSIDIVDNNETYSLHRLVELNDSRVLKIMQLNNTGQPSQ